MPRLEFFLLWPLFLLIWVLHSMIDLQLAEEDQASIFLSRNDSKSARVFTWFLRLSKSFAMTRKGSNVSVSIETMAAGIAIGLEELLDALKKPIWSCVVLGI